MDVLVQSCSGVFDRDTELSLLSVLLSYGVPVSRVDELGSSTVCLGECLCSSSEQNLDEGWWRAALNVAVHGGYFIPHVVT